EGGGERGEGEAHAGGASVVHSTVRGQGPAVPAEPRADPADKLPAAAALSLELPDRAAGRRWGRAAGRRRGREDRRRYGGPQHGGDRRYGGSAARGHPPPAPPKGQARPGREAQDVRRPG